MVKEYDKRLYRNGHFSNGRAVFTIRFRKSDLWIAIDKASFNPIIPSWCEAILHDLWTEMEAYLSADPGFTTALVPHPVKPHAPKVIRQMADASAIADIGPMGAVAGAVAEYVAVSLKDRFDCTEIIIENGGDIYAMFSEELITAVFAGGSPLSEKIALRIPAVYSPLGICTSSGTVGPSLSFGKADAVTIVCRDTALADAYATAFANLIQTAEDISRVTGMINETGNIMSAVIIKDNKVGVTGMFDIEILP